jgi:hypothetical protein
MVRRVCFTAHEQKAFYCFVIFFVQLQPTACSETAKNVSTFWSHSLDCLLYLVSGFLWVTPNLISGFKILSTCRTRTKNFINSERKKCFRITIYIIDWTFGTFKLWNTTWKMLSEVYSKWLPASTAFIKSFFDSDDEFAVSKRLI